MYIVVELQTANDGTVASLVQTSNNRNQAESIYHQCLAAAAISALPKHACVLMTNEGFLIMSQCYEHGTE